jgi:hypothetical protein
MDLLFGKQKAPHHQDYLSWQCGAAYKSGVASGNPARLSPGRIALFSYLYSTTNQLFLKCSGDVQYAALDGVQRAVMFAYLFLHSQHPFAEVAIDNSPDFGTRAFLQSFHHYRVPHPFAFFVYVPFVFSHNIS